MQSKPENNHLLIQGKICRILPAALFLLLSLVLLAAVLPPAPVWITDNGNKYMITRNLAENGTLNFEQIPPELFPKGGFHFQHLPSKGILSFHSWVLPLLSVPLYHAGGDQALPLLPLLATLGVLWLLSTRKRNHLAAWGILLTTPVWLYSLMLWEMTLSIFFVLAGFFCGFKKRFFAAGLLLGAGIWFREELYLLGTITGLLLLCRKEWKPAIHLAAGALCAVLPLWVLNFRFYGHILGLHGATYAVNNRDIPFSAVAELKGIAFNFIQHLIRFDTLPVHSLTLALAATALLLIPGAVRNNKFKLAGIFSFILIEIILLYGLYRYSSNPLFTSGVTMGLFVSLPLAAGYFLNWRALCTDRNAALRLTAQAVGIYILLVPFMVTRFDIGLTWGARHYMCIMPLLLILSFRGFARMNAAPAIKRTIVPVLFTLGMIMQFWSFRVLAETSEKSDNFARMLARYEEKTVVTDVFFLPEQSPRIFFEKRCLEAATPEQTELLLKYCREQNSDSFLLIMSKQFRRLDNDSLKRLFQEFTVTAPPEKIAVAPGMELFIARCRRVHTAGK